MTTAELHLRMLVASRHKIAALEKIIAEQLKYGVDHYTGWLHVTIPKMLIQVELANLKGLLENDDGD